MKKKIKITKTLSLGLGDEWEAYCEIQSNLEPVRLQTVSAKQGVIKISKWPSPKCVEVEDMFQATMEHMDDKNWIEARYFCAKTADKLYELLQELFRK